MALCTIATATATKPALPPGYTLHTGLPPVPSYLHLRSASGLSPVTAPQAKGAVSNSWYGCHIRFTPPQTEAAPVPTSERGTDAAIVGMGRIIGDGGWYFHIADMAVLPEHQRRGLGSVVLEELLAYIELHRPAEGKPYITLFADPPGRPLYLKNEFIDSLEAGEVGMIYRADPDSEKAKAKRAQMELGGTAPE